MCVSKIQKVATKNKKKIAAAVSIMTGFKSLRAIIDYLIFMV